MGVALLDFNLYYLAAQLSQLFHIDKTDSTHFLTLCPKWSLPTADPLTVILRGVGGSEARGDPGSLLYHYSRIWEAVMDRMKYSPIHTLTPCGITRPSGNFAPYQTLQCGVLEVSTICPISWWETLLVPLMP